MPHLVTVIFLMNLINFVKNSLVRSKPQVHFYTNGVTLASSG